MMLPSSLLVLLIIQFSLYRVPWSLGLRLDRRAQVAPQTGGLAVAGGRFWDGVGDGWDLARPKKPAGGKVIPDLAVDAFV